MTGPVTRRSQRLVLWTIQNYREDDRSCHQTQSTAGALNNLKLSGGWQVLSPDAVNGWCFEQLLIRWKNQQTNTVTLSTGAASGHRNYVIKQQTLQKALLQLPMKWRNRLLLGFTIHVWRSPRLEIRCMRRRHWICQVRSHIESYHCLTTTLIEARGGIIPKRKPHQSDRHYGFSSHCTWRCSISDLITIME
jgi:hypothetical protein